MLTPDRRAELRAQVWPWSQAEKQAALDDLDAKDAEIARLSRLLAELGVDPATGQIVNLSGLNEAAAWATITSESPEANA